MAKRWMEHNENPRNESASDCVVRALSFLLEKDYRHVLTDLAMEGLRLDTDFRFHNVWTKYSINEYDLVEFTLDGWNPTVNQFAEATENLPSFVRVLCVSSTHAVTTSCGLYFDTWDSGRRKVKYLMVKHAHRSMVEAVIKSNGGYYSVRKKRK